MDERRQSASTNSDGRDDLSKWDIKASPMLSIGHFSDSDGDTTGTMPAPGKMTKPKSKKKMSKKRDGPYREGNITYTTDAEVKQTPEVSSALRKRMIRTHADVSSNVCATTVDQRAPPAGASPS